MLLINCEINLLLIWPENYVMAARTAPQIKQKTVFARADATSYVPVVILLAEDN